uniref:GATOR complex protein NPRL3 n=1 Tax=Trichuris muris TaxID=70415 RepID=A0A5S6QWT1_TRIMR
MVERGKNPVVPLCVFLVVKCTNDDRMLFMYPFFREERMRSASGKALKSPCALRHTDNTWKQKSFHGLIENDQLNLLDDSLMSFLFTVKPEMCNQSILVKINDVRFVGYPVSHDSSSCSVSNGPADPVNILRYNIVFAIRAEAPRKIVESFVTLAKEFALAIQHEEHRCGYLTSQVKIMLDCFETVQGHRDHDGGNCVYDAVLKKSNLAQTLKQAFVDLLRTGTVSLCVNGCIEVSWNVHQRYSRCLTKPLFRDEVPAAHDGMIIKPYHAVLLLESVKSIVGKMRPDHSTAIVRFLNASNPVKPLLTIARELDYDLEQVFRIVQHLIYWGKTIVIFPLTEANIYIVHPEADLTRSSLKKKFEQTFCKCCLGKILSSFSMPTPLSQFIARCGGNRDVAVKMVVWLLRHGLLMQLHTFIHLCYYGTTGSSASPPKIIPCCESLSRVHRHPASTDRSRSELFVQLLPYFDGEHHIEEIMFFETLSRAEVMKVICDYDDILVLSVHEDPFLERCLKQSDL